MRILALAFSAVVQCLAFASTDRPPEVLFRSRGAFITQQPLGDGRFQRRLRTDGVVQSEAVVRCGGGGGGLRRPGQRCAYAGPGDIGRVYLRNTWTRLVRSLPAPPRSVAMLGFGAIIPSFVMKAHPEVQITAVDIDPDAVDLAVRFLGMPELQLAPASTGDVSHTSRRCSGRLCVLTEDAREFVHSAKAGAFDAVIVDLFDGDGIPPTFVRNGTFLQDLSRIVRHGVLFTEDDDTATSEQLASLQKLFGCTEALGFSKNDLAALRQGLCPCREPGDECGCGEENRFVLAVRRPSSHSCNSSRSGD